MGLTLDEAVWDETQLLSCPSAAELLKRAKQPAEQDEAEEQALMDANRAREVLQKRLLRATSDILRGIQINLGGSGERGDASQKRLAALYESPQWHELDTCLFLPRTRFENLLPAVFHSMTGHFPRFTDGAKSLLQLTCEEEMIFIIKSAWTALRHYGRRKALGCEDFCVMVQILRPVMKALQVSLPSELKTSLDQEDERSSGRRRDPGQGDGAAGAGKEGRTSRRKRSRSR